MCPDLVEDPNLSIRGGSGDAVSIVVEKHSLLLRRPAKRDTELPDVLDGLVEALHITRLYIMVGVCLKVMVTS